MDKLVQYAQYAWEICKRIFGYGSYCVKNDFLVWDAVCADFWLWVVIGTCVIVCIPMFFALKRLAIRWRARSRARKRELERLKVADEAVMRAARWSGDNAFDQASTLELASEIRLALDKNDQMGAGRTLYDIIGVPVDASTDRISEVCLRLAEKYRPEKNPDDLSAAQVFSEIEKVYETLMDSEKRAAYDAQCRSNKPADNSPKLKIV